MPDDRRYGVLWMNRTALAPAFQMEGAFNDVSLRLQPDALEAEVLAELDRIRRYLHEKDPDSEASHLAFKTFANLMRMWAHN